MKNDHQDSLHALGGNSEALLDAARADALLPLLRATREALAHAMAYGPLATVAQSAARLQATGEKIAELLAEHPEESTSNALRNEAADRLAAAKVVQLAGRRGKRSAG